MSRALFESIPGESVDLRERVAATAPTNPFYTDAYVEYRRGLGDKPHLFLVRRGDDLVAGCTAFLRMGRLARSLEITSLPRLDEPEPFWDGLWQFCKRGRVTDLQVCTFASPGAVIPATPYERWRKPRVEYSLGLVDPNLWKHIRKGHLSNIKKGRKIGLALDAASDREACLTHSRLIESSMNRRLNRGERVTTSANADDYWPIVRSGAGKLYRAVYEQRVVSSNLILLSQKGGYNHSQGTSPEGMDMGAAHFLIYEIANALRAQSFELLNLGGTDQLNSGLERSKDGFGDSTTRIELETAAFSFETPFIRTLKSAAGFVSRLTR